MLGAIASHRPYRSGLGITEALAGLTSGSGIRCDAQLVAWVATLAMSGQVADLEEAAIGGMETFERRAA